MESNQHAWDEADMKNWFQQYGPPAADPSLTLSLERRQALMAGIARHASAHAAPRRKPWWTAVVGMGVAAGLTVIWITHGTAPGVRSPHPTLPTPGSQPVALPRAHRTASFPVAAPFASGSIYIDNGIPYSRAQFITVSAPPGTVLRKEEELMALQGPATQQVWLQNGRPPIYESTIGLYYFYQNPQPSQPTANDWTVAMPGQTGYPANAKQIYLIGVLRDGPLTGQVLGASWFGQPLNGPRTAQNPSYAYWPLAAPGTILGKEETLMMGQSRTVRSAWTAAHLPSVVWKGSVYEFQAQGQWVQLTKPAAATTWPWYGAPLTNGAN